MPIANKTFTGAGEVVFAGSAVNYGSIQTASVTFEGYSVNEGPIDVSDEAVFNDYTRNLGNVECDIIQILGNAANDGSLIAISTLTMGGNSTNNGGIQAGVAVFGGNVVVNGEVVAATITVSGNAVNNADVVATVSIQFLDSSSNTATITGTAIFRGTAINQGIVDGIAEFYDTAANDGGTITGNAEFYDSAANDGGTIEGNAVFADTTSNTGTVQGDAQVAPTATNTGTVQGNETEYTGGGGGNNYSAPSITSISSNTTTPSANGGTFTITANINDGGDTQNIALSWEYSQDNTTWITIAGAINFTYSGDTNVGNYPVSTWFRIIATNSVGSVTSSSVNIIPTSQTSNSITLSGKTYYYAYESDLNGASLYDSEGLIGSNSVTDDTLDNVLVVDSTPRLYKIVSGVLTVFNVNEVTLPNYEGNCYSYYDGLYTYLYDSTGIKVDTMSQVYTQPDNSNQITLHSVNGGLYVSDAATKLSINGTDYAIVGVLGNGAYIYELTAIYNVSSMSDSPMLYRGDGYIFSVSVGVINDFYSDVIPFTNGGQYYYTGSFINGSILLYADSTTNVVNEVDTDITYVELNNNHYLYSSSNGGVLSVSQVTPITLTNTNYLYEGTGNPNGSKLYNTSGVLLSGIDNNLDLSGINKFIWNVDSNGQLGIINLTSMSINDDETVYTSNSLSIQSYFIKNDVIATNETDMLIINSGGKYIISTDNNGQISSSVQLEEITISNNGGTYYYNQSYTNITGSSLYVLDETLYTVSDATLDSKNYLIANNGYQIITISNNNQVDAYFQVYTYNSGLSNTYFIDSEVLVAGTTMYSYLQDYEKISNLHWQDVDGNWWSVTDGLVSESEA